MRDLPTDFPTNFPPLKAPSNNLSLQLTSFVGRESALIEIKRFLASARLLTLTGTGGIGKTHLALQVAEDVLEHFRDGVWLVELALVVSPDRFMKQKCSILSGGQVW